MLDPVAADQMPGESDDPARRSEAAHMTAAAIVNQGRQSDDPELLDRLVRLVEEQGLDVLAALWADSPASTLPGALWRLYLLRDWVRRDPRTVAERYRLGVRSAEVHDVVAGVGQLPGPQEVERVVDAVLSGVYVGDLAVTLERAAAFCRVLATGSAFDADDLERTDADLARAMTRRASALVTTAEELEHAAALWRAGQLD